MAQAPPHSNCSPGIHPPLCRLSGLGSFAHFQLEPGEVARAVSHATVQEFWYIIGGEGQMWRHQKGQEPTTESLRPGICLTIPPDSIPVLRQQPR